MNKMISEETTHFVVKIPSATNLEKLILHTRMCEMFGGTN